MTVYQIVKEIHKNANESILTFEGFNSKRDTELKNQLLWAVYEKYGKDRGSINKLIAKIIYHLFLDQKLSFFKISSLLPLLVEVYNPTLLTSWLKTKLYFLNKGSPNVQKKSELSSEL